MTAPSRWRACAAMASVLFAAAAQAVAQPRDHGERLATLTCDRDLIAPESYELTTTAQAVNLHAPRYGFWDRFIVNEQVHALLDLNLGATDLAERALDRDPRNLMAHSILARQYVTVGSQRAAERAWHTVLANGGVVVWTATLYDVDAKSYFLVGFDRHGLRIYRQGQFAGPVARHLGVAQFPEPDATGFYAALAGCPDPDVAPVATVPWTDVREIRSGNWVLWFKLTRPATVTSDRNKTKSLREIKVNLHGETGHVEFLASPNPDFDPWWDEESERWTNVRGIGLGPYDYQLRLRNVIARFVDPDRRITLSSAGRGAGW